MPYLLQVSFKVKGDADFKRPARQQAGKLTLTRRTFAFRRLNRH
jgi:hypothetical protein